MAQPVRQWTVAENTTRFERNFPLMVTVGHKTRLAPTQPEIR